MPRTGRARNALANPAILRPWDPDDKALIRVVIETPKGSRNKYSFNADENVFELKTVLPAGMAFPYDFGFVPSTLAADGDPVDVLVLMDEPAAVGCVVTCRIIGIIEGEQTDGIRRIRNDRVLAVEHRNHDFSDIHHIDDMGKKFGRELEEFFVNYHRLSHEKFRVLGLHGPNRARNYIEAGRRALKRR